MYWRTLILHCCWILVFYIALNIDRLDAGLDMPPPVRNSMENNDNNISTQTFHQVHSSQVWLLLTPKNRRIPQRPGNLSKYSMQCLFREVHFHQHGYSRCMYSLSQWHWSTWVIFSSKQYGVPPELCKFISSIATEWPRHKTYVLRNSKECMLISYSILSFLL